MKVTLNNCIVYRASPFEIFASKFFPYHIPFISKRKRVKIKNYFKYRYKARLHKDIVSQLRKAYINNIPNIVETDLTDWEWEVEHITHNSKIDK